jgi:flagellar biogenesis protein FliO
LHWSPQTKKALVRMVGGLSFVLAIFWAMIWMMRMRRAAASGPVGVLKDLGRISLSAECHLHLIQLGRRVLLLGISGDNVQTLAEVTDADEMAELLDVCGAETRRAGTAASQAVAPRHSQIRPGAIRSAVRAWTAAVRAPRRAYFEA